MQGQKCNSREILGCGFVWSKVLVGFGGASLLEGYLAVSYEVGGVRYELSAFGCQLSRSVGWLT